MHKVAPPFKHSCGSREAKIILLGEAWGKNEDTLGVPFVGWSGYELARVLFEAQIVPEPPPSVENGYLNSTDMWYWWKSQTNVFTTNVFAFRPKDNKIESICGNRAAVGKDYKFEPIRLGNYILPEYLPELDRLALEIMSVNPNLIIPLGATASWAILHNTKITTIRGAVASSVFPPNFKTLPTFHPANILYQWQNRPIFLADMIKAKRESAFAHISRPKRTAIVDPTIKEILDWTFETLALPTCSMGVDIETKHGQIECIGFARSRAEALVIPFITAQEKHYWSTLEEEARAWNCVNMLLQSKHEKVFQNGLFDIQYLYPLRLYPRNAFDDTMILHHALFPELPKGLGFLGSIYTNEASWKLMRGQKDEELKRDE